MVKVIILFLALWLAAFAALGTWRKWKLKIAFNWAKVAFQAFIATLIVIAFLTGIVLVF